MIVSGHAFATRGKSKGANMAMRLLLWTKGNPVKSFFLILFFPVYGFIFYIAIVIPIGLARDWYYEEFPFSTLAVRLFAEPGEETLMFRYRLGDRLLYVRSDVAQPARYSGREATLCNPLWGECKVFPLRVLIHRDPETNKVCIGRYPDCPSNPNISYNDYNVFWIEPISFGISRSLLIDNVCKNDFHISSYGNYKNYYIDRAAGTKEDICNFIKPNGVFDSLLTAMETGNYDKFPRNQQKISAD